MTNTRFISIAIILAFLLAGLIGHDPWKPDEGYTFGLVLNILENHDWVVPTLAGEPFMEKPPLYFVTAAATALAFSPLLPLHDGARIASLLYVAIALLCTGLAARRLFGPGHGLNAVLLLLGSLGLVQHAHEMITDTALLAGFGIAVLGLAYALERPRLAGALLGTGVGVGFMSKGLVEPAMMGLAYVMLPLLFREWRVRAYFTTAAWALLFVFPWLVVWPTALYLTDAGSFIDWFWVNNFGRYFGFAHLGADSEPWYYTNTLPWFTFPAGPLALWAVVAAWRRSGRLADPGVQMTATLAVAIVAILSSASTARQLYAMPLLIPLAILASTVADRVPRRIAQVIVGGFALIAAGVAIAAWGIWGYGVIHRMPPSIPTLSPWLPRNFHFTIAPGLVLSATFVTLLFAWLWVRRPAGASWPHLWAASLVLIWGMGMTLLLPWLDNAKSFREPFEAMAFHIPRVACVSSSGLGEPQRAMLHYYAGIKSQRLEAGGRVCPYHVVQTSSSLDPHAPPPGDWELVWQGARPGEVEERFSLYEGSAMALVKSQERMSAR
jgi:4-amino-4-deoxy-L-arabinose transferase-like glycosyltransferase